MQAASADVDSSYADYPRDFYDVHLADAPGWKVGGWPPWGRTDPNPRYCTVCNVQMIPLLTITSFEWDGGEGHSWAPHEDQAAAYAAGHCCGQDASQPTKVEVGSTDNMQIYVCPTSPKHPHTDLIASRALWFSPALPGRTHDLTAARTHRIIRICERLGFPVLADRAYLGAGPWVTTPVRRPPGRDLSPTQPTVNRALSATRAPVERGVARLKSWRILHHARCSPNRMSTIATAVLTLERQR